MCAFLSEASVITGTVHEHKIPVATRQKRIVRHGWVFNMASGRRTQGEAHPKLVGLIQKY